MRTLTGGRLSPGLTMIPLFAILLFLAPAASADDPAAGLTVHQIARLQNVGEAVISPDGAAIAYVLTVPRNLDDDEDGPAHLELHVVATGPGATSRPFVTGERVSDVAWVPGQGREISFVAQRGDDEHDALWAISLDGGEARKVLALDSDVGDYSWSPDGRNIAALAKEKEPKEDKKLRDQGFTQTVYEEQERPVKVWIAAREGGAEARALDLEGYARGVSWSPAGDRLAVKVSPGAGPDDGLVATKVWIVSAESGEVLARLDNPGKLGDLAWSPSGTQLAMISAADPADPRPGRLMVVGAGGGELRDLLPGLEAHVLTAAWRDDEHLIYLVAEGVETWIGTVAADGGGRETLLAAGGPIWDDLRLAQDGTMALVGSTPTHPDEVFHLAAGAAPRRLTDSNPWLAEVALAPQEVVRYAARDGLEIEGLLIRPLGEKAGQRTPLVLIVHGGPEGHDSNGWLTTYSSPGQALAAKGFAVFYPNYRASTGRGVAFSKLDHGDLAGKEFDDLVDAVDHLVAIGLADRDRVGITGGSYGGFATAWASTYYSERFAAGVMFVGISNNTGKMGTSDIPVELYQVHSRKWPWTDWQYFLERSPIYYVAQARTPLLIAGGDADPRVHPSQSLQLYRYLKLIGETPVRLVTYPGEKHGNRRAASRLDFSLRLVRWMEHYLKGPGGDPPTPEIDYGLGDGDEEPVAEE